MGDDEVAPDLTLDECRFLSFDGLDNDTLTNKDFGGGDAVVRDGRVKISAIDCAFGPHAVLFRLQGGGKAAPTLLVDQCSMLLAGAGPSAVFNVLPGAAAKLDAHACLFSRPDDATPDAAMSSQVVVIRQAEPGGVTYQDRNNRYQGFDAYWVGGAPPIRAVGRTFKPMT